MSAIYRFTGPPENWITGIGISKWAVNENNRNLWEKLQPGDIALLHSTAKTAFSRIAPSAVIGYAVIASKKWVKDDPWWMQEKEAASNMWPYVFSLDEVYLFSELPEINFKRDNLDKDPAALHLEVDALAASGIRISTLNRLASGENRNTPAFPVNGSASSVNPVYEKLILANTDNFYLYSEGEGGKAIEERLDEAIDSDLSRENIEDVRRQAQEFTSDAEAYTEKTGVLRIRRDNETQKRRIAKLENYTCQVCGFNCRYQRSNGEFGWIIEVDHIIDKAKGGTEEQHNLWVLCPNCHKKKTRGVIKIDTSKMLVTENGVPKSINDNHLWI